MKDIFAQRLKTARLMSGLSQTKLAEAMSISKQSVSKYEKGQMLPDSKMLIRLTTILERKPDYFFRPIKTSLSQVDFRKKHKLTGKKLDALKANIADKLERYLELEMLLGIDEFFINPILSFTIESVEDVENVVSKLLIAWDLGSNPLPNIVELLENKGIKVIDIPADNDFDGLSAYINNQIPVIVINSSIDILRKRFTVLHELGHLLLSIPQDADTKTKEKYCNRFAGAMLMPRKVLDNELGKRRNHIAINELIEIKEYYGISLAAIIYRAKDLNIITNNHANRFWKLRSINQNLRLEIGYGEYKGKENSGRFEQLLFKAIAEELITLSKAAVLGNRSMEIIKETLKIV